MIVSYKNLVKAVIEENSDVLNRVNEQEIENLLKEIEKAKRIQIYAMGRMQLAVRAFAMRLKHMGFDVYIVYDTTTPAISDSDLLLILCGVTNIELNIIKCAKEAGARVGILTAHPENEHGKLADLTVLVPGQIFGAESEVSSIQPMASLLEQSLFLFVDIIVMMLIKRNNIDISEMHKSHTNLEGIGKAFASNT